MQTFSNLSPDSYYMILYPQGQSGIQSSTFTISQPSKCIPSLLCHSSLMVIIQALLPPVYWILHANAMVIVRECSLLLRQVESRDTATRYQRKSGKYEITNLIIFQVNGVPYPTSPISGISCKSYSIAVYDSNNVCCILFYTVNFYLLFVQCQYQAPHTISQPALLKVSATPQSLFASLLLPLL